MSLDLTIVVPGTADARALGCTCPNTDTGRLFVAYFYSGHFFDPWCPVHRPAILAEVQRQFGRPQ